MGLITFLALLGMASSVIVVRTTHGEAAAINLAGSLRMQAYRIAARVGYGRAMEDRPEWRITTLTEEFEQRLTHPRITDHIPEDHSGPIGEAYDKVRNHWRRRMKPLLTVYQVHVANQEEQAPHDPQIAATVQAISKRYLTLVAQFVDDIDHLVELLEQDAESRLNMLGLFQGFTLLITLLVVSASLYLLHMDVVNPLRALLDAAEKAGSGDFTVRLGHTGPDELGRLGQAFNTMAADLSQMYGELEQRVAKQTRELSRSNRSLRLLYETSRELTNAPLEEGAYRKLLEQVEQVVAAGPSTLCLLDPVSGKGRRLAQTGALPPMCRREDCQLCKGRGGARILTRDDHGGAARFLGIPVRDQSSDYGVLIVELPNGQDPAAWQVELLETIGQHIGVAVGLSRRLVQQRRLALLEERGVIARELHDSLAQSLSYLKIKVSLLDRATRRLPGRGNIEATVAELREGIGTAYRQLRELLTTFRLQMDGDGLAPALADTVAEFSRRGNIPIGLENRLRNLPLSANQEIHVLQIVREALSNVIRHSQAQRAWVQLRYSADGSVEVCVDDDGQGLAEDCDRQHHYGLAIMRERAHTLGGQIEISNRPAGGTRVRLLFDPARAASERTDTEGPLESCPA